MGRLTTIDELDALSRVRPLTPREAHCLALAIKRSGLKGQKPWTRDEISRLRRYLKRGKKPAQIAIILKRTERAVWRRMYKLGLSVGDLCPDEVFTASRRRRVKSSIARMSARRQGD